MPTTNDHPIPNSYWVIPGRFLAGEYPGALIEPEARGKLRRMLETGITCFIDLTEPGESGLHLYESLLMEEAARLNKKVQLYFPSSETNSQIMMVMTWSPT